jgi:adenylate cyclase
VKKQLAVAKGHLQTMKTTLIIKDGGKSEEFSLDDKEQVMIGREANNNIVIDNPAVSRLHAMVRRITTGHYMLSDLGSANGTFLNNKKVTTPALLTHGDTIRLGNVVLQFHAPPFDEDETKIIHDESTVGLMQDAMSTVFVSDIRGFTKLSETLNAKLLSDFINAWCRKAQEVIEKNGGHVDKFIGDCVMASWNHTSELETEMDILRAMWAAVDLYSATSRIEEKFGDILPFPIRIGVGLNTGPVVVGNVGGKDARSDLTMLGDTVNMAFRYEAYTKTEGTDLNLGAETYRWIPHDDELFRRIEIELPGRASPEIVNGTSIDNLKTYLEKISPR